MGDVIKFGSKERNQEVVDYLSRWKIETIDKLIWDAVGYKTEIERMKKMGFFERLFFWPY